jgi:hypothetical protein
MAVLELFPLDGVRADLEIADFFLGTDLAYG